MLWPYLTGVFHKNGKLNVRLQLVQRFVLMNLMALDLQFNGEWVKRFIGEQAPLVSEDELEKWILYEDEHVLALNKPAWLVCHPSKQGPMSSLVGAAKVHLETEKPHLVSRLDRETSGIVLIAKTRFGASQYQKAIEQRRVKKQYWLWVVGELKEVVEVNQPLARDMESEVYVKQTVRKSNSAQKAVTVFEPHFYSEQANITVVKVTPVTGRKHQIRAHAQWLGVHVLGDKIYGPDARHFLHFIEHGWTPELQEALGFPRQALHAASLEFEGIPLNTTFHAPLTEDLMLLNEAIGCPAIA